MQESMRESLRNTNKKAIVFFRPLIDIPHIINSYPLLTPPESASFAQYPLLVL